jgi:hypothetical protein
MTTKNGQFRDTGNIGNTRHRTKTKTIKQTRIKQTKINKPKTKNKNKAKHITTNKEN